MSALKSYIVAMATSFVKKTTIIASSEVTVYYLVLHSRMQIKEKID